MDHDGEDDRGVTKIATPFSVNYASIRFVLIL